MSWWFVVLCALAQGQRTPVPQAPILKEKERLVRDVFKSEYARKSPGDRMALAKKLLAQGLETTDDPAAQYVMLREAADLAVASGDAATAVEAVGALSKNFEVDGLKLKLSVLTTAAQDAKLPESARAAADALLKLFDEALKEAELETAEKAASAAVAAARKAKDVPLSVRAEAKQREAAEAKSKQSRIKAARETLQANPDDAAANAEMGQFECFTKGNWEAGLPLLGKGSNEVLRILALRDLSRPEEVQEQIALGDAWKERADKETAGKERIRERALYWYELALPRASGLLKVKIEKAITSLTVAGTSAGARTRSAPEGIVGWWKLDEGTGTIAEDSSGYKLHGKVAGTTEWVAGQYGKAVRLGGADGQVVIPDDPSLRLTGDLTISVWFRKDEHQADWARVVGKGDHRLRNYGLFSGGKQQQGVLLFQQWEGNLKEVIALQGKAKIEPGKWQHVAVTVRGNDVILYVGGEVDAVGRRTGPPATSPDPLTFGFAGFHQPFPGAIDDVRIYRRALSEQEIATLAGR